MILADKVAVATDVTGVSGVLLLSGQTPATRERERTLREKPPSAGCHHLMLGEGKYYLLVWQQKAGVA
jgi:hypothetical protein